VILQLVLEPVLVALGSKVHVVLQFLLALEAIPQGQGMLGLLERQLSSQQFVPRPWANFRSAFRRPQAAGLSSLWALRRSLASFCKKRRLALGGKERVMEHLPFHRRSRVCKSQAEKKVCVIVPQKVDSALPAGQEAAFNRRLGL